MNTFMFGTIQTGTGAIEFGQPRNVKHIFQTQQILYARSHGIAAALGTEYHFV